MNGATTDGERGTACGACRLVRVTGTASVSLDASVTTEVALFTGTRQDLTWIEWTRGLTARSDHGVVELVQTYRAVQCEGHGVEKRNAQFSPALLKK